MEIEGGAGRTESMRSRQSMLTMIGSVIAVAFVVQVFLQGITMRNTGSAAESLQEMTGSPSPTPVPAPNEGGCPFTAPFEGWDSDRKKTVTSDPLTMHFDTQNGVLAYLELSAEVLMQGVQFGITAVEIGGGFSHFQASSGAGFVWMMKMAEDKTGVEFLQSDMTVRVTGEESDYHKLWEDSRLPGLRLKLPIAATRYGDACAPTGYILNAATLVRNGFYAVTVPGGAAGTIKHSSIKAFTNNIDLTVTYFVSGNWDAEMGVRFCIFKLPDPIMVGRRADPRAGYFFQQFRLLGDFTGEDNWPGVGTNHMFSPTIRLINRMRLPSRCCVELGRACNKLHFYVDPTTPKALWAATKAGIELWEPAFAATGGGVQAWAPDDEGWPDNYDHADICFNTVSWSTGGGSTFAIGQSVQDPRSGETLKANMIFTLGWLRIWMGRRIVYGAMNANAQFAKDLRFLSEASQASPWSLGPDEFDNFLGNETIPAEWVDSSPQLWSMTNNPSDSEAMSFLEQGIRDVTAHEVGHTIGLRHNFRGSTRMSFEDCQRTSMVSVHGLSSSIMDYTAFNVISEETRARLKVTYGDDIPDAANAPFFTPVIGAYDKWVIEYGYTVSSEEQNGCPRGWCVGRDLQPILDKYESQELEYSTDETRDDFDPYAVLRDLGSNPIDQFEEQFKVAKEGWANMFQRNMDDYQSWTELYYPFRVYRGAIHSSASSLTRFIGGVRTYRKHGRSYNCDSTGAGCDKQSNTPVTEDQQYRALDLILDSMVNTEYDPPAWYQKEAVKEVDDGYPSIYSVWPVQVVDEINALKKTTLGNLLSASRLKLLRLSERLLEKEAGSMVMYLFRTCSNRLLSMDLSDEDMRQALKDSTHLHDVRSEYVRLMAYSGDDQVVKAAIAAELSAARAKIGSVVNLVKEDLNATARIEEFFLSSLQR